MERALRGYGDHFMQYHKQGSFTLGFFNPRVKKTTLGPAWSAEPYSMLSYHTTLYSYYFTLLSVITLLAVITLLVATSLEIMKEQDRTRVLTKRINLSKCVISGKI